MAKNHPVSSDSPLGSLLSFIDSIALAWRLFKDQRVPIWTKSIPVLAAAYLIWPLDLLADPILGLGQLDDLGVLLLGMKLFLTLCPTIVVEELKLRPPASGEPVEASNDDDTIDTTFRVLDQEEH